MGAFCPNHCISTWYLKHELMQNFWRVHPSSRFLCRCADNSGLGVQQLLPFLSFCDASWPRTNKRVGWSHQSGLKPIRAHLWAGRGGVCLQYLLLIEGEIPQIFERRCRRWRALKRFTRTQPAIVHRWPLAELSHHQLGPAEMEEGGGCAYLKTAATPKRLRMWKESEEPQAAGTEGKGGNERGRKSRSD